AGGVGKASLAMAATRCAASFTTTSCPARGFGCPGAAQFELPEVGVERGQASNDHLAGCGIDAQRDSRPTRGSEPEAAACSGACAPKPWVRTRSATRGARCEGPTAA